MRPHHRLLHALPLTCLLLAPALHAQPGAEKPGFHGMLVFGSTTPLVSHLPMFVPQHRYQGIWEVSFGDEGDKVYRRERARPENAGKFFTLAPTEAFRLPELTAARKSFKADVFVGHFERPGHRRILQEATVTVKRQIHWHPFRGSHGRPDALTYTVVPSGDELYLAHWISVAPSYDQVVSAARVLPAAAIPATAAAPTPAALPAMPQNAQFVVLQRGDGEILRAGESVSGLLVLEQGADQPAVVQPLDLKIGPEIYLERGELKEDDLRPEER